MLTPTYPVDFKSAALLKMELREPGYKHYPEIKVLFIIEQLFPVNFNFHNFYFIINAIAI